jgi:spermidine/putrescine transport system ATP-binding protein
MEMPVARGEPEYEPAVEGDRPSAVAELRGVSKYFGDVQAARDLHLRIGAGEFLSFLGPSGCGKTTALRMLAGFERPSEGDILIDGEVVNDLEPYRRPVNMVFQSYALFPHLNVTDNIAYGLRQRRPRLSRPEIANKVARALEVVRLADYGQRRISEMSGGQQQRVAVARAIVNEPRLLLLDEPLAALDRKLRKEMQIELQDLQRELGITFVLVTHDQEEALSLSDRICVMRDGRIVQEGSPQDLYDAPNSRYVADFVGTSNFFAGKLASVSGGTGRFVTTTGIVLEGRPAKGVHPGDRVELSIRPEQIRMAAEASEGSFAARVHNRIFLGEHTEYLVRNEKLGSVVVLAPRRSDFGARGFAVGDQVHISWAGDAALILHHD